MNRRGQTLALFAVTMLALVVMVGISLTIGMRVREKIELQTLADASAYSNAVVTARAHNQIAVWNRAQIAHMVTLAGVQSHISYGSWYVGLLKGSEYGGYATAIAAVGLCVEYPPCCDTARVAKRFAKAFRNEYKTQKSNLRSIDSQMATAALTVQGAAAVYGAAGKALYRLHMLSQRNGGLAKKVVELGTSHVQNAGEYSQTHGSKIASGAEIFQAGADSTQVPSMGIANGSRRDGFIRSRDGLSAIPPRPPVIAMQNNSITGFIPSGTAHFGRAKHQPIESGNNQAWADDEGDAVGVINVISACPLPTGWSASAFVKSSAKEFRSDHRFSPGETHNGSRDPMHDLGSCRDARGNPCNSVWIQRQEFNINPVNAQQLKPDESGQASEGGAPEQWRQPVNVVSLERDYQKRSRRDPWEFNFSLSVTDGSQTQVDLKKNEFGGAADVQRVAATGITYYHRHMDTASQSWLEPPNFFNPYWRATLVPADIDGRRNLAAAGGGVGVALKAAGFKGIQ